MSRYTKNSLKADLQDFNDRLKKEGSDWSFKYGNRNGYHAIDVYKGDCCMRCLDCNEPPIKLIYKAQQEFDYWMSCKDV